MSDSEPTTDSVEDVDSGTASSISLEDDLEAIDGEFKATELDDSEMIRRNSVDHYKSPEAGPRESISNGCTAIRDAVDEGYMEEGEGEIIVRLIEEEQNEWRVEIQDNGIGLSTDRIEMIRRMGVSGSAGDGSKTGMFGIGWYANYKVVSASGRFITHSISRETEEETVCIWQLNGRKILSERTPDLRGNDYGTVISMYPKQDLSITELESYITRHAKSARENVTVIKKPATGSISKEEYPPIDVCKEYAHEFGYTIENDYVSIITSPNVDEDTLYVLDNAMDLQNSFRSSPWRVAIRIKTEEHTIFKSEDSEKIGLKVVPTDQYDLMPESKKDGYIPESDLESEDIITPAPTGSRDSLSRMDQFTSWLSNELETKFKSELEPILNKDIPKELSQTEMEYLYAVLSTCRRTRNIRSKLNSISNGLGASNSVYEDILEILGYEINVEDSTLYLDVAKQHKYGTQRYSAMALTKFADKHNAEIYMGTSFNETKCEIVRTHAEEAIFVKVDKASEYDKYTPLGWKLLKDIKKSTLSEYNLTESEQEHFENEMSTPSTDNRETRLTIRYGTDRIGNLSKVALSDLKQNVGTGKKVGSKYKADRLVLFPDSGAENVSDHYALGGYTTAIARCTDDEAEELLTANDSICTYDEYYEQALTASVETFDGYITGQELLDNASGPLPYNTIAVELIPKDMRELVSINEFTPDQFYETNRLMNRYTMRGLVGKESSIVLWVSEEAEREIRPVLEKIATTTDTTVTIGYSSQLTNIRKIPDWSNQELNKFCPVTYPALLLLSTKDESPEVNDIKDFFKNTNFTTKDEAFTVITKLMSTL